MVIKFEKQSGEVLYVGDDYDWRLTKKGLEGFASFEANVTTTDDYARDGATRENVRLDDKNRTIKICNMNWRNSDSIRVQLLNFFNYKQMYKIYVTVGSETRWAEGMLYRMSVNEPTNEGYMLTATMSFEFESPYLKSIDDFGRNVASLVPSFGFPWMSRIGRGLPVGVFNFDREVTIKNDGNNVAYPIIKMGFKNDVLNPKVSINDGFIRFIGTFNASDHITIDYTVNPPRVENNGVNILGICDRTSDFDHMLIEIGENTLSFDADNGTDEMDVSVYYNRLYTMI